MILEIFQNILYFLRLSSLPDVFWIVFPLLIATIVMLFYFEKYYDEELGWNTSVANSLVLLFISIALLRYIYSIGDGGAFNFIIFSEKTLVVILLLVIGILLLSLNFKHLLPEKIAYFISSPLIINLIAYAGILFVYSASVPSGIFFLALLIFSFGIFSLLNGIRIPIRLIFKYLKKIKEKEPIENIKKEKQKLKKEKKRIKLEEQKLKKSKLKESIKKKKEALKIKSLVNSS